MVVVGGRWLGKLPLRLMGAEEEDAILGLEMARDVCGFFKGLGETALGRRVPLRKVLCYVLRRFYLLLPLVFFLALVRVRHLVTLSFIS